MNPTVRLSFAFLSRITAVQRHRGRTHQAAGDDHRVSTTATDNFTGAQIASDAHQIVICAAVKRRGCRITTDEQLSAPLLP